MAWIQFYVTVATVIYVVIGIYLGLAQQSLVYPAVNLHCSYRIDLARDRLLSLIEQAPRVRTAKAQIASDQFSNLLQDTQARCANTAEHNFGEQIEILTTIFHEHQERRMREVDARRRLLEL